VIESVRGKRESEIKGENSNAKLGNRKENVSNCEGPY
jgi:hypothetical protein